MNDEIDDGIARLRGLRGFDGLPEDVLRRLVDSSTTRSYPQGGVVFEKGESPNSVYIILSGRIRILDEGEEWPVTATLGPGDVLGEVGPLFEVQRTRGAEADQPAELMVVPQHSFTALLDDAPDFEQLVRERMRAYLPTFVTPDDEH